MSKHLSGKTAATSLFSSSAIASKYQQSALTLEAKGAWRRAARQWLALFDCVGADHEREYAARQREKCLTRAEELTRLAAKLANKTDSK
ncbi:PerC family transcriptional regulator [Salmonella enterica]|nr:PerC family transcriptional regulator [Salmonella enterica subsp. diarizonae]EJM2521709.1 PerC family transcriptional regulator [Salmonella enterica]